MNVEQFFGFLSDWGIAAASVAGIVSVLVILVNVLKAFKVLPDGVASTVFSYSLLVVLVGVIAANQFGYLSQVEYVNVFAEKLSEFWFLALPIILIYAPELGSYFHGKVRGVALIGESHSRNALLLRQNK